MPRSAANSHAVPSKRQPLRQRRSHQPNANKIYTKRNWCVVLVLYGACIPCREQRERPNEHQWIHVSIPAPDFVSCFHDSSYYLVHTSGSCMSQHIFCPGPSEQTRNTHRQGARHTRLQRITTLSIHRVCTI
jgi:hypothetical protein